MGHEASAAAALGVYKPDATNAATFIPPSLSRADG